MNRFVRDTLTVETRNPTRSDPLDEKNIAKWGRGKVQTDAFMNLGTAQ